MILVEHCSLRCSIPALASTAARVSRATGSSPWHKHSWRALPMSQRHSASHWRRPYCPNAPTETPRGYATQHAAYQTRGSVCRKAAMSTHAEGQLRRLTETARPLHRRNDATGGVGKDVLQVAMQSYYVVSSSQIFLVRHSKHISKTAISNQSSRFATARTPPYSSLCSRSVLLAVHETTSSIFLQVLMTSPKHSPQV